MLNIAHRGASGYAPENTHAAFARAISMGADATESDIRVSHDGELVLIHDATVTRTTDGRGPVADHTLDELRALDAGGWFAPAFAGERIPTLGELVEGFGRRVPLVLEIKDAEATVSVVSTIRNARIGGHVQITSFLWPVVLDARRLAPELTLGFLSPEFDGDIIQRCVNRGIAQICPHVARLTAELVSESHQAGLLVRAYGVSRREQIATLFATGADGATVNWPDWMPTRRHTTHR
jgi:glycerophosphoryl diester phosphodiesterase